MLVHIHKFKTAVNVRDILQRDGVNVDEFDIVDFDLVDVTRRNGPITAKPREGITELYEANGTPVHCSKVYGRLVKVETQIEMRGDDIIVNNALLSDDDTVSIDFKLQRRNPPAKE